MEYGPCVRASSHLKSDSQRLAMSQNTHQQVPVVPQKFGGDNIKNEMMNT